MDVDAELKIVEAAKSDLGSFIHIYNLYFAKITVYVLNRIGNRMDAEDIVAEVFADAINGIRKFDTKHRIRFGAWLYKTAHNKTIDYYRKQSRSPINTQTAPDDVIDQSYNPEQIVERSLERARIQFILSKLKSEYSAVITLKFYSDMTNDEMAFVLGIKKTNLAVLVHRATKAFADEYSKNFGG